jgi:hypothetical protein
VSRVMDMTAMFCDASTFNHYIGSWDVSHVRNMIWMFHSAASFSQDIGSWEVSSVTCRAKMFYGATAFNQNNIRSWDVSRSINKTYIFGASFIQSRDFL